MPLRVGLILGIPFAFFVAGDALFPDHRKAVHVIALLILVPLLGTLDERFWGGSRWLGVDERIGKAMVVCAALAIAAAVAAVWVSVAAFVVLGALGAVALLGVSALLLDLGFPEHREGR